MKGLRIGALIAIIAICAAVFTGLVVSTVEAMTQGHDMSQMPGMKMSKPKAKRKTAKKTKRGTTSKRRAAKTHQMGKMPGTTMPGMNMPNKQAAPSSKTTPTAQPSPQMQNMPGMQIPSPSPNPQASPQQKMEMNMPMPSPSPGASPKTEMNMPGMQMPTASPKPQASPQHQMHMPMPSASPSASPMGQMPGMDMGGMNMNMGPLMVMLGNGMGIRVGSSDTNVMSMGAMGSGTSWQPSSGPMHMQHWIKGDWLLMFHYNLFA